MTCPTCNAEIPKGYGPCGRCGETPVMTINLSQTISSADRGNLKDHIAAHMEMLGFTEKPE